MTSPKPRDVPASVRARLLNLSKQRGEDFTLTLVRYVAEGFLHRLSQSKHAQSFILKGALLLAVQTDRPYRPTRDIDFLRLGDASKESLYQAVVEIAQMPGDDDGLVFDVDSMTIEEIREAEEYGGWRASMRVLLGTARIPLQIDVAFGDAVVPGTVEVEYPALLKSTGPRIRAYPVETMIAEKVEALVKLGITNSRMKDFYDLIVIAEGFELSGPLLAQAFRATFARRDTPLPQVAPIALTDDFARAKGDAWRAFLRTNALSDVSDHLRQVVARIGAFVWPVLEAAAQGRPLSGQWVPGRGWTRSK